MLKIRNNVELTKAMEEKNKLNTNDLSVKEKHHKKYTPLNFFTSLKASTKPTMIQIANANLETFYQMSLNNTIYALLLQLSIEEEFKFEICAIHCLEKPG